jgi:hypothetical protein
MDTIEDGLATLFASGTSTGLSDIELLERWAFGPRQVGQIVKTKPLRRSCLRILDQSMEPRESALQATGRLSSPVRSPGFLTRGPDNPHPNHAQGHSRPIERLLRTLTRRARSRAGRIGIARYVSHRSLLFGDALPVASQSTEQGPGHGVVGRFPDAPISRSTRKAGLSDGKRP